MRLHLFNLQALCVGKSDEVEEEYTQAQHIRDINVQSFMEPLCKLLPPFSLQAQSVAPACWLCLWVLKDKTSTTKAVVSLLHICQHLMIQAWEQSQVHCFAYFCWDMEPEGVSSSKVIAQE